MSLTLSSSPHIHEGTSTTKIMAHVILALFPSLIAAAILFSLRALLLAFVTVSASVLSELLFCLFTKKRCTVYDLSAVVTGLILALGLPVSMPLWQAALGAITATAFVKMLFGGIGQNFANPAATARVILLVSFSASAGAQEITRFMPDAVSSATPLALLANGKASELPTLLDFVIGNRGGAMGETCIVAIIIGFFYLLWKRIISWETPVVFVTTVYLITLAVTGDAYLSLLYILSGGLFFGAVFMATDYATTPITKTGKIVFALGCGVITAVIRLFCGLPEGVSYAILLMNLLTPYIEKITVPRAFGGVKA